MNSDVMYKGFDIEVAIIHPLMTRLRHIVALSTINAVARSMWFQSLYAEADF